MIKKILPLFILLAFVGASQASITINANGVGNKLVLADGSTFLAAGDIIRVGTFSLTNSQIDASSSFSFLNAAFTPIGESITNAGTLTQTGNATQTMIMNNTPITGAFSGAFNGVSASYLPQGTQLFIWAFNTTTASSATQWGVFTNAAWTTPADLGTVTLSLSTASMVVVSGSAVGSNFALKAVPEPTSIALLGTGLMMAGSMIRRRK